MAQANNYKTAVIGSYTETINTSGEIVITGIYKGTRIEQTVACNPPCILFIDTITRNLMAFENIHEAPLDNIEFVKLVKGIA